MICTYNNRTSRKRLSMTKNSLLRWLIPTLMIILVTGLWLSGALDIFNFDNLKVHRHQILQFVSEHEVWSVLAFVLLYALSTALSLPIATVLTLMGGFLFGGILGTLYIVIGATLGAVAIFLIARSSLGTTLREKAGPFYSKVSDNMKENAIGYMLFLRLVPIFPFFLVNILPALFNIRLLPYTLTTIIGIIPATFVYANIGRQLGHISTISDLASPQIAIAFSLLGFFALIPIAFKKYKNTQKQVSL